jgi:hypothetical protein
MIRRAASSVFLWPAVLLTLAAFNLSGNSAQDTELSDLLKKTAEYCDRLEKAVLDLYCREKVAENVYTPFRSFRSPSLNSMFPFKTETVEVEFDYQLIRKGGQKIEKRIPLKQEYAPFLNTDQTLRTKRFDYEYIIFGPLGLLGRTRQTEHTFRIVGHTVLEKKRAVILAVYPLDMNAEPLPVDKIWIDENDFSVMRIEWDQASLKNYSNIEMQALQMKSFPRVQMISEFGVRKNGLRFPSQFVLREEYQAAVGLLTRSTLIADYTDYRFFTVETSVDRVSEKK